MKVNNYGHAHQMKRMKKEMNKLQTILGRLVRDVERKVGQIADTVV